MLTTFHFARDAEDHAAQQVRELEAMGDELLALRGNLSSTAVKREFIEWTIRPDLAYRRPD